MYPAIQDPRDAEPDGCLNMTDVIYETKYGPYLICEHCARTHFQETNKNAVNFIVFKNFAERMSKCQCENKEHNHDFND